MGRVGSSSPVLAGSGNQLPSPCWELWGVTGAPKRSFLAKEAADLPPPRYQSRAVIPDVVPGGAGMPSSPSCIQPSFVSFPWRCVTGAGVDLFMEKGFAPCTRSPEIRNFGLFGSSHAYPEGSWDMGTLFPLACAWVASQGCVFIWQEPFPLFRIWDNISRG